MTKGEGGTRINAVEIGEASIEIISPTNPSQVPVLKAKYALTNAETYERFGAGNWNNWSDETKKKLNELLASMERDICIRVFEAGPSLPTTDGGEGGLEPLPEGIHAL